MFLAFIPEYIADRIPEAFLTIGVVLLIIDKWVYPLIDKILSKFSAGKKKYMHDCKTRIKELEDKIDKMELDHKEELVSVNDRLNDIRIEKEKVTVELAEINGSLRILRNWIEEKGFNIDI